MFIVSDCSQTTKDDYDKSIENDDTGSVFQGLRADLDGSVQIYN